MSDTQPQHQVLGVGTILGESFAVVFRHLGRILLIGALPAIVGAALNVLADGAASQNLVLAVLDPESAAAAEAGGAAGAALAVICGLALWSFAGAALTRAAWDAHTGGFVNVRTAIATGLSRLLPVMIWLTAGGIVVYLGFLALVVPGLWLAGVWAALLPVLAIERLGFGAFRRSAELTRGYRWPLVGLFVLFVLVMIALGMAAIVLQGVAYMAGSVGVAAGMAIMVTISAVYYALSAALVALAYARLREIKEGSGRAVADVFE